MSVLIFGEIDNGEIKKTSLEAIYYGAQVASMTGTSAKVVAIGDASADALAKAGNYGVDTVLHANDAQLTAQNPLAYASILASVADAENASVIVIAKTSLGDSVAARLTGKLKAALASNVTELPNLSNGFSVMRSIYTGKAFAETVLNADKKILCIKKNAVAVVESAGLATVTAIAPALNGGDFAATVTNTEKASGELSLSDADIIVSGGRGMKGPEHWQPLLDLAKALHAATGCSKPVSDLDWRPHHEHIGQTGIKVSPNLYIACGISGAIQHLAGVNSSKCIVVINKDPEAPFFKAADYGIVGDVFEVLPKLTKAIEASN
ncbi:MAG: electron transfer flavoprotein subunit alpha/FixB family protein [Spirosomataceae bacterium]